MGLEKSISRPNNHKVATEFVRLHGNKGLLPDGFNYRADLDRNSAHKPLSDMGMAPLEEVRTAKRTAFERLSR